MFLDGIDGKYPALIADQMRKSIGEIAGTGTNIGDNRSLFQLKRLEKLRGLFPLIASRIVKKNCIFKQSEPFLPYPGFFISDLLQVVFAFEIFFESGKIVIGEKMEEIGHKRIGKKGGSFTRRRNQITSKPLQGGVFTTVIFPRFTFLF